MVPSTLRIAAGYSALLFGGSLLTGCTLKTTAVTGPSPAVITGKVYGGQNPVMGAEVFLLAASETGYGNASTSLLTVGDGIDPTLGTYVSTDSSGAFAFSSDAGGVPVYDYVCPVALPTQPTQVYVYVRYGNPGDGGTNQELSLMTALGDCGSLNDSTYIAVNEVTTVAAAYALSGFATDATHISSGTSALSIKGMQNAFLNAAQLADPGMGVALLTTPSGGTVDQQQVYTLANILAACVNTDGTETAPPSATACYTLMNDATTGGTSPVVPSDTATAAINIAHNPAANVAALAELSTTRSPFPHTSAVPNDFTVGINYDASFMGSQATDTKANSIAIDAEGNAWFAYRDVSPGIGKFSSTGVVASGEPFSGNGTLGSPGGLAIDQSGSVWVADTGKAGVVRFSSDGLTATQVTGGTTPAISAKNVVIDAEGNVWADNYSGSAARPVITRIVAPLFSSSSSTTNEIYPLSGLAIDDSGNLWTFTDGGGLFEIDILNGTPTLEDTYISPPTSALTGGVAVDSSGAIWIGNVNSAQTGILKSTGSGNTESFVEYTGGGQSYTGGIAIDGGGNVWSTNLQDGDRPFSEINNGGVALSPTGFEGGNSVDPHGIAVDGSGDIWAINTFNSSFTGPFTVSELIGAAVPVVTPIAAGLVAPYTPGSRP